jgi:hypothetical protein
MTEPKKKPYPDEKMLMEDKMIVLLKKDGEITKVE